MAQRSKKIRAPSDYFLWVPQELGVQSKIFDFCERNSRPRACRFFDTLSSVILFLRREQQAAHISEMLDFLLQQLLAAFKLIGKAGHTQILGCAAVHYFFIKTYFIGQQVPAAAFAAVHYFASTTFARQSRQE